MKRYGVEREAQRTSDYPHSRTCRCSRATAGPHRTVVEAPRERAINHRGQLHRNDSSAAATLTEGVVSGPRVRPGEPCQTVELPLRESTERPGVLRHHTDQLQR